MNSVGHVRLGAALIAALALHALFFLSLNEYYLAKNMRDATEALQISILARNTSAQVRQNVAEDSKAVKEEQIAAQSEEKNAASTLQSRATASDTPDIQENQPASEAEQAASELGQVSNMILSTVLAKVSYPSQARRKGWEGEAQLQFSIHSHVVKDINLSLSTGHPILDQAAYKALASVSNLPLNDGRYWLPIIFRIE